MDLNNLERGGLKNMQNLEADFNESRVWDKIQSKEKRRPFFWYWISSMVAIGFIIFGAFLFFNKGETTQISDSQKIDNQSTTNNLVDQLSKNTETSSAESLPEQSTISQKKGLETKSFAPSGKDSRSVYGIEKIKDSENIFSKSENIIGVQNYSSSTIERPLMKTNYESFDEKKSILDNIEYLPILSANLEVEKSTNLDLPKVSKARIEIHKNKGIIVSIFGGIGYHTKNLSLKGDALNRSYLDLRNANETTLESFAFGFDIDQRLNKKWLIGTGVEMVYHNEKLNIQKVKISNLQDIPMDEIPTNLRGQNGFEIKRKSSEYFNQYRLLNVPFRIGYIFNFKKIRVVPETGLAFNISHTTKGHIQNPKEQVVELSKFFKTNVGIGYRAGFKFLAPARNGFLVYLKPSFEYNPNNIASDDNPILQKRNFIRMDVGVSRSF